MRKDLLLTGDAINKRLRRVIMSKGEYDKAKKRDMIGFLNSHSTRVTR